MCCLCLSLWSPQTSRFFSVCRGNDHLVNSTHSFKRHLWMQTSVFYTDVFGAGGFSSSGRTLKKLVRSLQREMWGGRLMSRRQYSASVVCLVSVDFWLSSHRGAEDTNNQHELENSHRSKSKTQKLVDRFPVRGRSYVCFMSFICFVQTAR